MKKIFSVSQTVRYSIACAVLLSAGTHAAFGEDNLTAKQYCDLAIKEAENKEYAAAIFDYTKSLAVDPEYWKSYGCRSSAKYNSGDYLGARKDVDICIAHMPPSKGLTDLKNLIEARFQVSPEQAARVRAAQQMLMMAQFGGDITSPGYQIMMQAQRIKAARDAQAAMAGNSAPVVAQSAPVNSSNSVSDRLQAMQSPGSPFSVGNSEHTVKATSTTGSSQTHATASAHAAATHTSASTHATSSPNSSPFNVSTSTESATSSKLESLAMAAQSRAPLASATKPASMSSASSELNSSTPSMTSQQYFDRACGKGHAMDLQGAIKDYDEAIKLNPKYGEAYANRGSARFNAGDKAGALADFNAAVECMPGNEGVKALRDRVASNQ